MEGGGAVSVHIELCLIIKGCVGAYWEALLGVVALLREPNLVNSVGLATLWWLCLVGCVYQIGATLLGVPN